MPETQRLLLAHVGNADHVRDLADLIQLINLASRLEYAFELIRNVKMVFDRVFAPAGDDRDVADSRSDRFFNNVLNQRLIDKRQHLLRLSLCGRQKTST